MSKILEVPYQSQRDAEIAASDRWQSIAAASTHSMLAEFLKPECLSKPAKKKKLQIDDYYLTQLLEATSLEMEVHEVHTQALLSLGIESHWSTELTFEDVARSLDAGIPIVCELAHLGSNWAPEGQHSILVIGEDADRWVVNDPWGNGFDYRDHNGAGVFYAREHGIRSRWMPNGTGCGRIVTAIDGKATGL